MNLIFDLKWAAVALIVGAGSHVSPCTMPHTHKKEPCGETHLALFLTLEVNTGKVIHKLLMILSWRWIKLIISKNHDYSNRSDTGKHAMQGDPDSLEPSLLSKRSR